MTHIAASLKNVTKRFGGFVAVEELSFDVKQGEIYGFLGPNGAGKTTTLRMMLDIVSPSSGEVMVLGSSSAIPVRRRIGYLPEERGLYRKMKAADSIAYFARLRGLNPRAAKERAYELLNQFGLEQFARTKNEALSKGMAQKVQLLATIAHEPEFLILDEPFSGLDPINQQTLEDLIRMQRDQGRTIIFSTHVMQHAERLCDRFLIIAEGKKRFEGTLSQARASFAKRVHVRTKASPEALSSLGGVANIRIENHEGDGGETTYELELEESADGQVLLASAVDAGLKLSRFEQAGATLHDIFVSLVGQDDQDAVSTTDEGLTLKAAAE
ncbi:MAG: ATP-binding cassette domain-containing protein [Marinicaulis sp.]|nr:ATP-binding cassette domain-containing protein [Marinicaulis sp.]NNL90107.1 ATP-binding cassette domain-containing protein [Marinicaulis sp.]